jgi:hypothetical protein
MSNYERLQFTKFNYGSCFFALYFKFGLTNELYKLQQNKENSISKIGIKINVFKIFENKFWSQQL